MIGAFIPQVSEGVLLFSIIFRLVLTKLGRSRVTLLILLPRGRQTLCRAPRKRLRELVGAGASFALAWPSRLLTMEHPTLALFILKITIPTHRFLRVPPSPP